VNGQRAGPRTHQRGYCDEVFFTDFVVSELELFCDASGFMVFSDCESELLVVVCDSTVVLGAGAGAVSEVGVDDDAGAGVVTTVGAAGVC
jgi:hypothetical protein